MKVVRQVTLQMLAEETSWRPRLATTMIKTMTPLAMQPDATGLSLETNLRFGNNHWLDSCELVPELLLHDSICHDTGGLVGYKFCSMVNNFRVQQISWVA